MGRAISLVNRIFNKLYIINMPSIFFIKTKKEEARKKYRKNEEDNKYKTNNKK